MTQIDFYTHVENKLATACKLAAKAFSQGNRVLIFTPDEETTEKLDQLLWTSPNISFVPHCRAGNELSGRTPVIVDHAVEPLAHHDVLLNLHPQFPPFFSRFQRLLEIVSLDEADSLVARSRFRFYRGRGYDIRTHKLGD